jgi:hypothetical protein
MLGKARWPWVGWCFGGNDIVEGPDPVRLHAQPATLVIRHDRDDREG